MRECVGALSLIVVVKEEEFEHGMRWRKVERWKKKRCSPICGGRLSPQIRSGVSHNVEAHR